MRGGILQGRDGTQHRIVQMIQHFVIDDVADADQIDARCLQAALHVLLREGDVKHTGEPEEHGVRFGVTYPLEVWREIRIDKWDPQYVEDFSAVGLNSSANA